MTTNGTCERCGGPLTREEWNSNTDVVICNNLQCVRFRSPVSVPVSEQKRKTPPKRKYQIPEWLGGSDGPSNIGLSARLQRLQHTLYSEE